MKLLIDIPLVFVAYDEVGTTESDRADSKEEWDETCAVLEIWCVLHPDLHSKFYCVCG